MTMIRNLQAGRALCVVLIGAAVAACGGGDAPSNASPSDTAATAADDARPSAAALAAVTGGTNLATAADGTTKAAGTSFGSVVDANAATYWSPTGLTGQRISIKGFSATVDTVLVDEPSASVRRWRLVDQPTGRVLASGTTLGAQKVITFAAVTTGKLDLFIDLAVSTPRITEFEVYDSDATTPPPGDGDPPTSGGAPTGASCRSTGSTSLSATRVVRAGETFDGGCRTFNPTFGGGGQAEGQDPVFRVEAGGVLKNVIIGANGADGIHVYGNATIDNITWTDVGEDALTVKAPATVTIRNITGGKANDKFFQLNAAATVTVDNVVVTGAGKLFRENGGKCYPVKVTVNRAKLTDISEAVFRSDCSRSTFLLTNAQLSNVKAVCYSGGQYASCGQR